MKRRRHFRKDDLETWRRVQTTITPITPKPSVKPRLDDFEQALDESVDEAPSVHRLPIRAHQHVPTPKSFRVQTHLSMPEPLSDVAGLTKNTRRAIRKGSLEPAAKIDLHGLKQDEARIRLVNFLRQNADHGHRLVLVVTGKGGHRRSGDFGAEVTGVIRRAFPEWLRAPDMAPFVSHFTQAHIRHGGEGAWYVFIRASARRR